MRSSYDVLAAIDMERVAGHPVGGRVAQRGNAARNVLLDSYSRQVDDHQDLTKGIQPVGGEALFAVVTVILCGEREVVVQDECSVRVPSTKRASRESPTVWRAPSRIRR
jgi:hypothetical protein